MILEVLYVNRWGSSIPRESGDDPADLTKAFRTALYSPRERG